MGTFSTLRQIRHLQRRSAPYIRTLEDLDIIVEIGAAQDERRPIGTSGLVAAKLAPRATLSRRLARLKKLGIVRQQSVEDDKRRSQLLLDPEVRSAFDGLIRKVR